LLADVGGFNDGFFLVASIFFAPLVEIAYKLDFLNKRAFDGGDGKRLKTVYSSQRYK